MHTLCASSDSSFYSVEMNDLASRSCKPCEGGVEPLSADDAGKLMNHLDADWQLDQSAIRRTFSFPGFARTIAFVNAVAWIATVEGHHPQMLVNYGRCEVTFTTNAINGLSDNDFICAAKIDSLVRGA